MSRVRQFVAATILCVCFGCSSASDPQDGHRSEASPRDDASEVEATPKSHPRARGSAPEVGRGTLIPADPGCPNNEWWLCERADPARASICVSIDADGNVDAIDQFPCTVAVGMRECAPNDCPWVECGGCLVHVERSGDHLEDPMDRDAHPWILSAVRGGKTCEVFAGKYEVYADASCNVRAAN